MNGYSLILDILRRDFQYSKLKDIGTSSVEWDIFLEGAFREGVAGFIFSRLRNDSVKNYFPENVLIRLEEFYLTNLGRNTIIYKELESIFKSLNEEGIICFINRGVYFSKYLYCDLGIRAMADVDMVIFDEDLEKFKNVVLSMGYSYFDRYPFFFYKNGCYIDLHLNRPGFWRVDNWPCGFTIKDVEIQRRSLPLENSLSNIRVFDVYDFILGCCQHLQEHSFSKLMWFMDVAKLIESKGSDFEWKVLEERAENFNLKKPFYFVIEYLTKNNLVSLPHCINRKYVALNFVEEKSLNLLFANKRDYVCGWMLFLFLAKGMKDKFNLLRKILFLKKEYIPLSKEPGFSSYLRRFLGIIGYILRMAIVLVMV